MFNLSPICRFGLFVDLRNNLKTKSRRSRTTVELGAELEIEKECEVRPVSSTLHLVLAMD